MELEINDNQIESINNLHYNLPIVEKLHIKNNLLKNFQDLDFLEALPSVEEICLEGNPCLNELTQELVFQRSCYIRRVDKKEREMVIDKEEVECELIERELTKTCTL